MKFAEMMHKPLLLGAAAALVAGVVVVNQTAAAKPGTASANQPAVAPAGQPATAIPMRVYWGTAHNHTSYSFDSGMFGVTLGPDDLFRFARGGEVTTDNGVRAKLERPLDWMAITDHAEYLGIADELRDGSPELLANPTGKRWYEAFKKGPEAGVAAAIEAVVSMQTGIPAIKSDKLSKTAWSRATASAEKFNQPGVFTTLQGFEWTSAPGGHNLHRTVIFRDNADRVNQVLPFSAFDSPDPAELWKYMDRYAARTGGQVLAIPHNGNLSIGSMYTVETFGGKPMDRAYAQARIDHEPLMEITQIKGDSETSPFLSPNDEFADFERWDFDFNAFKPVANDLLKYNYVRSAFKTGLALDGKIGVNPYQAGVIGGSDAHVGASTNREDNFFGEFTNGLPSAKRWNTPLAKAPDGTPAVFVWQEQAAGLGGVWARENTRAAIWDALKRKEVYATTGDRLLVRVFAGWGYKAGDVNAPDFANKGYAGGVPMGGNLWSAPAGKAPILMVRAQRDPQGPNLDRIQIVKGWVDAKGETHERIFDVAVSGGRKIGADGRCKTPVGNTVNIAEASYTNTIGATELAAYWKDPAFDARQRAYYYVRVIQIPSPRWTAYDQKRYGIKMTPNVPMTVTDRAYTSPIWYAPTKAAAANG